MNYAAFTLQSLRATIGPLHVFSTTSLESQESYLTTGMLPYKHSIDHSRFLPPAQHLRTAL